MSFRNSRIANRSGMHRCLLLAGDLPHLGDLLMHHLKAVQTAVVEGNWNFAQHLELTPATGSKVVTRAEMRGAQRLQFVQMRLQQRGKGIGGAPATVTPQGLRHGGGKASPSPHRPLPRSDATSGQALKSGVARVSSFSQTAPFASSCANTKVPSSASESQASFTTSQGTSTSSCWPHHGTLQCWRSSSKSSEWHSEARLQNCQQTKGLFRKSEERRAPRNRTSWGDKGGRVSVV